MAGADEEDEEAEDAMGAAARPDDGVDQLLAGADEEGEGLAHVLAAASGAFLFGEILPTGLRPRCGPWKSGHSSWAVPPRAC